MEPTSASSPGSEGSTSPPRPTASNASDRSSGTPPAPESSSDGGRLFPVGETSRGSALLPTPSAASMNRDEELEQWTERNLRMAARIGHAPFVPGLGLFVRLISSSADSPASRYPLPDAARGPRTIAGSGLSSPVSLASWDPDTRSWRTSQVSLLSMEDERFPRSWERWPTSGMTRRGRAFALPTSAPATVDNGSLSLPTPYAGMEHNGGTGNGYRTDLLPYAVKYQHLHTPTGSDTHPTYDHRASPGYTRAIPVPNLAAQVEELLPTPKTPTGGSEGRASRKARGSGDEDLEARLRSLGDPMRPPSDDGSES